MEGVTDGAGQFIFGASVESSCHLWDNVSEPGVDSVFVSVEYILAGLLFSVHAFIAFALSAGVVFEVDDGHGVSSHSTTQEWHSVLAAVL